MINKLEAIFFIDNILHLNSITEFFCFIKCIIYLDLFKIIILITS
jgi:hypothetical protein